MTPGVEQIRPKFKTLAPQDLVVKAISQIDTDVHFF